MLSLQSNIKSLVSDSVNRACNKEWRELFLHECNVLSDSYNNYRQKFTALQSRSSVILLQWKHFSKIKKVPELFLCRQNSSRGSDSVNDAAMTDNLLENRLRKAYTENVYGLITHSCSVAVFLKWSAHHFKKDIKWTGPCSVTRWQDSIPTAASDPSDQNNCT